MIDDDARAASPMPGDGDIAAVADLETELRIWCAVRTDLEIPVGKLAIQSGHAFVAALWSAPLETAKAYMSEAGQAKIAVRVKNEAELFKSFELCKASGLNAVIVEDAGRTVFNEPTFTTMAVGPCLWSDLPKAFKRLRLL
jgi:PTH2 family peptidyl-tRNA hydrolase